MKALIFVIMVTCQTIGSFTYCFDSNTGQTVTCQRIGAYTYCN